jgi:hypothetical protein
LRIAETIEEELRIADKLIKEGLAHSYKAGELLEEVKSMVSGEKELDTWIKENITGVVRSGVTNSMRLFNGEEAVLKATCSIKEGDTRIKKEPKE